MPYAGTYHLVAHIKDAHANEYRDHEAKWALDLDQQPHPPGYAVFCYHQTWGPAEHQIDGRVIGGEWSAALEKLGYSKWPGKVAGNPHTGASGYFENRPANEIVHTLDFNCLDCEHEPKYEQRRHDRNAVFVYLGHGAEVGDPVIDQSNHTKVFTGGALSPEAFEGDAGYLSNNWTFDHKEVHEGHPVYYYDLGSHSVGFVRLAYLGSCMTAGGVESVVYQGDEWTKILSKSHSIGSKFYAKGADCVVAFSGLLWDRTQARLDFDRAFIASMKGNSLFKAYRAALKALANDAASGVDTDLVHPQYWGDKKTSLKPPKEGTP